MSQLPGISTAYKKDGTPYYRASVTYNRKHISLGSYPSATDGSAAYQEALLLLSDHRSVSDYTEDSPLTFSKYVILANLKTNGIYFKTPIYLYPDYFLYHISPDLALKFDRDDLFFYASHTIQQKGGYLFVCHYGSQYSILSRYGIRRFAIEGRDYLFMNGDRHDYRYQNIKVINHYMGVTTSQSHGKTTYTATIHTNGNYIVGRYQTEEDAAIAYNKAADYLQSNGYRKQYIQNYISTISSMEYADRYQSLEISDKLKNVIKPGTDSYTNTNER